MKITSRAASAAILLIAGAGMMAPAAIAAEKNKKEEAAAPKLSPEFRKAAQPLQAALTAKDYAAAEPALAAAEAAASTEDDKYYAQVFRLQFVSGKLTATAAGNAAAFAQGQGALVAPLDALIANPKTPQADVARFNNVRGKIEYDAKHYKEAIAFWTRARQLGFQDGDLGLSLVKAKLEGGDIAGGTADLKHEIEVEQAAGRKAPEAWYDYAIAKLNAANMRPQLIEWLQMKVKAYPSAKSWRNAVIIYGFAGSTSAQLDKRQKIDLWRLLHVNKALADQNDYAEFAQDLYDVGLPSESKAIIEEGRATGKIPASSSNNNMLYNESLNAIKAEGSLAAAEKRAAAAPNGAVASATGDAYFGNGNYAKAIEMYKLALSKGSSKPDEVNTHLGMALALSGDKEAARAAFNLVKTSPRAEIVTFWLLWLDQATPAAA
ncbi:MAG: hypothetical protein B7Y45_13295 [Sphingomonas sp. 28-66-16]|nr:MAG: hypothetical protein B7Y45_13295 [Sphingomonas sp. 28-66-16]